MLIPAGSEKVRMREQKNRSVGEREVRAEGKADQGSSLGYAGLPCGSVADDPGEFERWRRVSDHARSQEPAAIRSTMNF